MLTLIKETKKRGNRRMGLFLCSCGEEKEIRIAHVKSGNTRSCGCLCLKMLTDVNTTHGGSKTRLYECWTGMKQRSRLRTNCNIFPEWRAHFSIFREWSLENGYRDDLVLCRDGDTGDYEPGNARWDTLENNNKEASSKWEVTYPDGTSILITNLKEFCENSDLSYSSMYRVANGRYTNHKQYKCRKMLKETN